MPRSLETILLKALESHQSLAQLAVTIILGCTIMDHNWIKYLM